MKVLLVIDVQNDFLPGGSLAVPGSDVVIPVINRIQSAFDLVVATQDWHPPNHTSFASNHEGRQAFEKIPLHGLEQTLWPDHCVQGSVGAAFHNDLDTRRFEAIFRKGTDPDIDSYSGFYDNDHRKSTGLAGYLREKNADELYFCGLAADICVYFSMMDALDENFPVRLIDDATCPLVPDDYRRQRELLAERQVEFVRSDTLSQPG